MNETSTQLFQQAQQWQRQGNLSKAWAGYQAILKKQPMHIPTLTSMGSILYQQKEYQRAIDVFEPLLKLQPFSADIWYRTGMTYAKMDDEKAINCFRKVLKIHPTTAIKPRQIAKLQLAKALKKAEKYTEAKKITKKLIEQNPKNASAYSILGEIAQVEQESEIAYTHFQKVIELVPNNAAAYLNLGSTSYLLKKVDTAIQYFEKAIQLRADFPAAYRELALCFQYQGQSEKALNFLQKAVSLAPKDIENYRKIADYYRAQGDHKASIDYGKQLLALVPTDRGMLYNVGLSYSILGYVEGSLPYFQKAYSIEADAQTAYAVGNVYQSLKEQQKAKEWFEKTLTHDATHYSAIYNLIFQKMENCDWQTRAIDEVTLVDSLKAQLTSDRYDLSIPRLFFNYIDLPMSLHLQMNENFAKGKAEGTNLLKKQIQFTHQKSAKKRLHIGYISPDFRDHAVGRLVANLFQQHDRTKVKVHAYFLTPYESTDKYAQQIATNSEVYRDFAYTSTVDAAQQIYADGIDVLIDLAGHTANHRLDILALQPAPIQVHLIGYPDTTGQPFIQYYLGDKYLTPKHLQPFYTEKIWHLPSAFVGEKPILNHIELSRKEVDLPENAFVFVGFNRPAKIEPALFQAWMNILNGVENSVLWLSDLPAMARQNLIRFAEQQGIAAERLIFSPKRPYDIYLKSHQLADLFLDTWHYSAGSTAVAALSAGLPVLTCQADNNAARMGGCIVAAAGLPELICDNLADYETKAITIANSPELLEQYKARLAKPADQILLFNHTRFAENLETAFWEMYEEIKD